MKANPQIGEVWFIEFSYDQKPRHALVVGSHPNSRLAVSSVLQITTQHGGTEFEVTLPRVPWLREQSYVNAQTIQPVKWTEFVRKAPGQFYPSVMAEVRQALSRWLVLQDQGRT